MVSARTRRQVSTQLMKPRAMMSVTRPLRFVTDCRANVRAISRMMPGTEATVVYSQTMASSIHFPK